MQDKWREYRQQAEEYADSVAPKPKHDETTAGVGAFFVVVVIEIVFCTVAGLDLNSFSLQMLIVAVAAGLLSWLYYRSAWQKRGMAIERRYRELQEQDANRT